MRQYEHIDKPWLTSIPENWDVKRLKYLFQEVNKRSTTGEETLLSLTRKRGLIPQSELTDKPNSSESLEGYKVVKPGQLVMNKMQAWSGMFDVAKVVGLVSPDYTVFQPSERLSVEFFLLLFKTPHMIGIFNQRSKGLGTGFLRLYTSDFGDIEVSVPEQENQHAIVRFLDKKLEQIDTFIQNKRRLIALLEEQKAALINQAVTKGLDEGVEMKESGLEGIGEVPKHWSIKPGRYLFKEINERSETGEETSLSVTQTYGVIPTSRLEELGINSTQSESAVGNKICDDGDLILNKLKAHLGVFFRTDTEGLVSPDYTVFRPIKELETKFYELLFHHAAYIHQFKLASRGIVAGFMRLYTDGFNAIPILYPPVKEQREILAFLNRESSAVEKAMENAKEEINLINEYRTTLISEVVTGKLDVRGAA